MRRTPWPQHPLDWTFRSGPLRGQPRIAVDHGCWLWCGSTDRKGYGEVYFYKKDFPGMRHGRNDRPGWRKARAHQLTYFLAHGNAPKGAELGHTCLRVRCCHPDHVRPVTQLQNYRDKFHPPEIPETLRRTIELRLALDEPPRKIADDLGFSVWTLRTMAEQINWRRMLPELMAKATLAEYDDSIPFRDVREPGMPF